MPPGWYPDPSGAPSTRYWDGHQWTLAQSAPGLAPRKRPVWPWILVGVVVLFLGGCGALIAMGSVASRNASKTPRPSAPYILPSLSLPAAPTFPSITTTTKAAPSITYRVESDGALSNITYFDGLNDQKQLSDVSAPWSLTFDQRASYPILGVLAQTTGLQVSCTISVNGQVRDQQTATGRYSLVNCHASSS